MQAAIADSLARILKTNDSATEYPFDFVQNELSQLVLRRDFDSKQCAKDLCELALDKYKDIWYHGLTLLKNILIVSTMSLESIPSRDTHLIRIRKVIEANGITKEAAVARVFLVLEKIKRPTPQLLEIDSLSATWTDKKQSSFRAQFKNCWLELLRCSGTGMSRDLLVKLLRILPESVMPFILDPQTFSSFFSECFTRENDLEISLLSVSGLFHLISRHNLGEPTDLYSRLYTLISPVTMKKGGQSNRVFQLLVKALRSPFMPTQYVGVFSKKLIRVSVLVESPSMALWLLVSAFNLMQAHPIVSKPLLHRESVEQMQSRDSFDLNCTDIDEMVKALGTSSLWEIEILLQHTDPSIVRMANMFKTNFFSRKAKTVSNDDYLLISDEQLFNRERKYGSHSKAKKSRGEVELDGMIGEDTSNPGQQISIAAPIDEKQPTCLTTEFQRHFERLYPVS